jgi:cytochrome P450
MLMMGPRPGEHVPLDRIDLYDPERYRFSSQHPAWHSLREHAPVWQQRTPDGTPFWSVTRYAAVNALLKDTGRFGSEHGTILAVVGGDPAGGKTINLMDPPRHTYVRVPSIRTMSTHVLLRRREGVRDHVRRIIADFVQGGEHDFAQLMLDLPMAAVGEILGIPQSLWSEVPRWSMAGVAPEDPVFAMGSPGETLQKAHHELFALFTELIRNRRAQRADDLISVLLELDYGGRRLHEHEVLLNCYSFVMGAATTTPHVATHMLLALLEQPDAWGALRSDPCLTTPAIEESLRWASPTNHLMRRTLTDVEVEGTTIPAGELVCAWVASANRDERVFHDPYRFDPRRSPNPHLAFGIGPHYCIGGPAARVALILLLDDLVAEVDRFEPAGEVTHLHSNFINGVTSLPVAVHPVRRAAAAGRREALR